MKKSVGPIQSPFAMLYEISLTAAISQMLFFAGYLSFGSIPPNPLFKRYRKSRRIMAAALLLLALNYMVHDFINPRFNGYQDWAIWMNLSTYFCEIWLFFSSLVTLLDLNFEKEFWRRTLASAVVALLYIAVSFLFMFYAPISWRSYILIAMSIIFLPSISYYGIRLSRSYRQAVKLFDATHSDDISAYIHWMSIIVYWAIIYGTLCGLFTFLPDKYVWIWVASSIPFYIYIFISYQNYMLFYEKVESLLEDDETTPQVIANDSVISDELSATLGKSIDQWVSQKGYPSQD